MPAVRSESIVPLPMRPRGACPAEGDPPLAAAGGAAARPEPSLPRRLPAHQRLPGQPDRPRCLADVGLGRDPPRLPRPLRGGRRQAPDHPGRSRHPGRRHGEPGDARPAVAGLLPAEDLAAPRHGDAKYGTTENIVAIEDAGIRAYVPLTDFAHRTRLLRPGRLHLRPRARRVPLPAGASAAPRTRVKRTEGVVVYRGRGRRLQRLPGQGQVHDQRPRPQGPALVLRRLPREGPRLPRDRGLQESDPQAAGLGRAAVRRGQGVAWLTPAPLARLAEREHPGAADRGGPEPEALPGRHGLGTASCPLREPPGTVRGATERLSRHRVTISSLLDRTECRSGGLNTGSHKRAALQAALLQHPAALWEPVSSLLSADHGWDDGLTSGRIDVEAPAATPARSLYNTGQTNDVEGAGFTLGRSRPFPAPPRAFRCTVRSHARCGRSICSRSLPVSGHSGRARGTSAPKHRPPG